MHPDTPPDESNVLDKVETALKQAVRQHAELTWEYGTRIKRQKYVYLAVRYFTDADEELPVTYSWYKFGAVMPASPETGTIGPVSTQMPTPGARESGVFQASFDELVAFFEDGPSTLPLNEEHWYASDLDFLSEFYRRHAPEEYRELYLGNVELRRRLGDAIDELETRRDRETTTSDDGVDSDDYEEVGRAAARIHMGLTSVEYLSETLEEVRRFTNLVEDAFLVLSQIESDEITEDHLTALEALEETYSEWVWEYPALLMSKETAEGPNASTLRKWSAQKHFSVEDNLSEKVDAVARVCSDAGLTPTSAQYPDHQDEIGETSKRAMLSAMRRDD